MTFYTLSPSCQVPHLAELYERHLGCRTDGVFVEVGAYDGELHSNSSGLADLGWRGLYIEPVIRPFLACRMRHVLNSKVTVLRCAVGENPGTAEIEVANQFSSLHPDTLAAAKEVFHASGNAAHISLEQIFTGERQTVDVVRLETILTEHAIPPGFDLLVVDVEGHEASVFNSFELATWAPKLIVVELLDMHPSYAERGMGGAGLRQKILGCGYQQIHADPTNTVFARSS